MGIFARVWWRRQAREACTVEHTYGVRDRVSMCTIGS